MRRRGIALVGLACVLAACGAGARQRDVRTAFDALSAAQAGFTTYSRAHEEAIVAGAHSEAEGKTLLAAWRHQTDTVVHGFELAYATLALAALDPSLANLSAALAAAGDVYRALAALKGALAP